MPTVTVQVRDANGNVSAPASASWTVQQPSPYKQFPGIHSKVRMGMRSPDDQRFARLAEVEAGASRDLTAWRIFVEPWTSPTAEGTVIDWAISEGMLPVISYKTVSPSLSLQNDTADYLNSKGVPIAVARWHEPRGDTALGSTTAQQQTTWRNMQTVSSPIFRARANLSFGPLVNGFLISTTNGRAELMGWLPDADLNADIYDWVGADIYQAAPDEVPSLATPWPGERMRDFADWIRNRGFEEYRLLVGEYNGNHGDVIADACEALLSDPQYWCAMLFNSTTGNKGFVLEHDTNAGDRLGAFQDGISDPRAYP